jgi:CMP-N-acetylneuraminic acid synthetase
MISGPDNCIAVIPARGGSKRLPRKNILPFRGKPLIAWTIEAALKTGLFKHVLVSTDDPEIAAISKETGAEVPFLRDACADDTSPVSLATIRAVEQASLYWNERFDHVVQLFACCPLRDAAEILRAWNVYKESGSDFLVSAFKVAAFNAWALCTLDEEFRPTRLFPHAYTSRTQDLPPVYIPSGAIWIARTLPLKQEGTFYGAGHRYFPMRWRDAIDIDDAEDFHIAAALADMAPTDLC